MRSVFKLRIVRPELVLSTRVRRKVPLLAALALGVPGALLARTAVQTYHSSIVPILEKHCYECHGDGYDKGKVAFDQLETDPQILKPELWVRVLLNTRAGLMPAERKPRLSPAEQATLERWIKYEVFAIDPANPDPGRVTMRRLNRVEYRNTVRDLLGVDYNTDHEFPPDDSGFGFDNIGDVLTISPMLMEKYVAAAQAVVAQGVPTVPRKPIEQVVKGMAFEGKNAGFKWGDRQLVFSEPASVAAPFHNDLPGSFRVKLELEVNGSYTPDPGRARVVFKIDGQEVLNQEFGYYDEKVFTFDSTHRWNPGDHTFSIELEPTAPSAGKKETIIDLFVNKVTVEGPLEKNQWVKTENYERYFPRAIPKGRKERRAYATEILTTFAEKAYRRPLHDDETGARLAALAEAAWTQPGKTFEQGVAHAMAAVLASPRFLFRQEAPASQALNAHYADVDEYSLASRLSYFLWSTMPDEELMSLAPAVSCARTWRRRSNACSPIRAPTSWHATSPASGCRRATSKASPAIRATSSCATPARKRCSDLLAAWKAQDERRRRGSRRQSTRLSMPARSHRGCARRDAPGDPGIFRVRDAQRPPGDRAHRQRLHLPERGAGHALWRTGVIGKELRQVTLPAGSPRGGVLTQGSALLVTSNPDRTSPVKRGLFVLDNFLGTPPPPPPADIPALEASESESNGKEPTLRDVLKVHRENPLCASCHNRMDPLGLAFENFNALGLWREKERRQPIDAAGQPDHRRDVQERQRAEAHPGDRAPRGLLPHA